MATPSAVCAEPDTPELPFPEAPPVPPDGQPDTTAPEAAPTGSPRYLTVNPTTDVDIDPRALGLRLEPGEEQIDNQNKLAESQAADGTKDAPIGYIHPETGRVTNFAGCRRTLNAKAKHLDALTIQVIDHQPSMIEIIDTNYVTNQLHLHFSPVERGRIAIRRTALENDKRRADAERDSTPFEPAKDYEIAAILHETPDDFSRLVSVVQHLDESLLPHVHTGKIPFSAALELVKLDDSDRELQKSAAADYLFLIEKSDRNRGLAFMKLKAEVDLWTKKPKRNVRRTLKPIKPKVKVKNTKRATEFYGILPLLEDEDSAALKADLDMLKAKYSAPKDSEPAPADAESEALVEEKTDQDDDPEEGKLPIDDPNLMGALTTGK